MDQQGNGRIDPDLDMETPYVVVKLRSRGDPAMAATIHGSVPPALLAATSPAGAANPGESPASARRRVPPRDDWLVKRLATDKPDLAAVTRESASPDGTWLPARMPAQAHDVLLAHGRIPDPHVGAGAAAGKRMGNRMATGHAAGVAGEICAARNRRPREVKVAELQAASRADGVDLDVKVRG